MVTCALILIKPMSHSLVGSATWILVQIGC